MNQQPPIYTPQVQSIVEAINKKSRIIQCVACFNETEFIDLVLKSIYNEVDQIVVVEGAVENRIKEGESFHSTDGTLEKINAFCKNSDPDKKVILISIKRPWKNLEEQKQTFLDMAFPGDVLIINDADEFYKPEDIKRVRQFFDLQPHATELIVNFLHFYRDLWHIAKPGPEWNPQHQRIIKVGKGYKYLSHPVASDAVGHCTYFSPHYQHRRFVPKEPINIYHYGYCRSGMNKIMESKKEYYTKELAAHAGANKKFDTKIESWFNNTEPVLKFDGEHPPVIADPNVIFKLDNPDGTLNEIGLWKDDPYYKKVLAGESVGNIWLCMTGQSLPQMNSYHNGVNI